MSSAAAYAERLPIKSYTTADGLGDNRVNRIVKDSRGFLWFCTAAGLSRFDGYAFTNFGSEQGLPDAAVNDLLETRAGAYWAATDDGLFRFDPDGSPVRDVPDRRGATAAAPMFARVAQDDSDRHAAEITVLREARDGTVWVGTNKDLYRLERTGGHVSLQRVEIGLLNDLPEQRAIVSILEDRRGSVWIATQGGLYRRRPDGTAARYTTRDGLPGKFFSDLFEDHEGHLWATTRDAGFFQLRDDDGRSAPVVDLAFRHADGLPHDWVTQLFETSDHRFWVATWAGVAEFFPKGDPDGRRFRSYGTRNGLSELYVAGIAEDIGGNLWLNTHSVGAMKVARDGFTMYGERDGINNVNSIFEDRAGNLCFKGWVLGDARTSVLEGAKLELVTSTEPSVLPRYGCFDGRRFEAFLFSSIKLFGWTMENTLRARSGDWWVGSQAGLYRFPPADHFAQLQKVRPLALYRASDPQHATQVFRLFEDSRGNIWMSTLSAATGGLFRWELHDGRVHDLADAPGLPSLKDQPPRSFAEDASGNIWIGFHSVLARYAHGVFTLFTASDGLPPGPIKNMLADRLGRLWLSSAQSGLVRVDDPGAERPAFVIYTTTNGLLSNSVEVIIEDRGGHVYVGGRHGVDRLDPATGRVKHFTTADGLVPGRVQAAYRDRNDVLWFGTSAGLARLAPAPTQLPVAPPVVIAGFQVAGVPARVSALGEREMSFPAFAPRQNHLQIDFLGVAFGPGEVLRYQYRLEGADADWSALSQQRTVTYASLAPGRYRFTVRAVNSDGIMSAAPAAVTFTILRPLWQRPWFIGLGLLAAALATHALYRYRLGRMLEMAKMRTRIATDLHDDIGANLTRIALLSEVATRQEWSAGCSTQGRPPGMMEDDSGPLASIARIARESVGSMSDIVWAINPARDSLLDLTRRMRQHAEEVFVLNGIDLRFDADEAAAHKRLGADVRRDLLLIFKEAANNAARHSRCSRVEIDFRVLGTNLALTVCDNGVGFDTARESDGLGVMSMQRRAQRLKGSLAVTSASGIGTTVTLTIAL
jgi:ligand-binding sensor domain-containing protein/two-component sensor histidine kinase